MPTLYNSFLAVKKKCLACLLWLTRVDTDSWRARRLTVFINSVFGIPFNLWNRLRGNNTSNSGVEASYDQVSGKYIQQTLYEGRRRWALVHGAVERISSVEHARLAVAERYELLKKTAFDSILEVGAGELNTLFMLRQHFGEDPDCYGIDLSLNRLHHGFKEFVLGRGMRVALAKADAAYLPYPDDSFDVVFSNHCLELMPKGSSRMAIAEMCRVARGRVVLFEPSYELGDWQQKFNMRNRGYIRRIPEQVRSIPGVELSQHFLLRNSINPFNRTAYHELTVHKPDLAAPARPVPFVCPLTKSPLEARDGHLYSRQSKRVYFKFESIAILDPAYAPVVTDAD